MNFNDINVSAITKESILNVVSEIDIFLKYCSNFKQIGVAFCSELRTDKHPSCYLYTDKYNTIKYKDHADGSHYDCFSYVMAKFNCNYYESLSIVNADFNISAVNMLINPRIIASNDEIIPQARSRIEFVKQPFNITDFNFWNQYGIDFKTLDRYNIISAKSVILYKNNYRFIFHYSKSKPRYGYIFDGCNKAYSPYDSKLGKWMYDGESDNVEGWNQLDETGDVIVITKSMKDSMCYHLMDINAISLPSESSRLTKSLVGMLNARFKRIIINMDGDEQGIRATTRIVNEFGFNKFYIDDEKDISDYIKKFSLSKAQEMIKNKLNDITRI